MGNTRAAALYQEWITQILVSLQPLRGKLRVVGYYAGERAALEKWSHGVDEWLPQPEGDLGARLQWGFSRPPDEKVLALGTDCLEVDSDLLAQALDALDTYPVVLGPAHDGGYYLVGAKNAPSNLFQRVRWSSPYTFDDQCQRCDALGQSYQLLPSRADIDTWDDWVAYCQRTGREP